MSDLKPCPFCGGEAERVGTQGTIRCLCHTMRTHDGVFPCPGHGSTVTFAWMWNCRAPRFTAEERAALEVAIFNLDRIENPEERAIIRAMLDGEKD